MIGWIGPTQKKKPGAVSVGALSPGKSSDCGGPNPLAGLRALPACWLSPLAPQPQVSALSSSKNGVVALTRHRGQARRRACGDGPSRGAAQSR
jgi:hypothetical protein